ncbi:MAG: DUF927 domain-containing protein, partial [Leadbetterella sp.]|nr:DUF927 domain-containing protein [Leadbetterella sp.]
DMKHTKIYQTSGSLEEWKIHVASLCENNHRLAFVLYLAFGGPLLELLGMDSFGVHLRSQSSTGKTTALILAASVYGGKSYVQNWRATDNALEAIAAMHNHTLLVLDELSQQDPKIAGDTAYMLGNNQGKSRCRQDASLKSRSIWKLIFLSSGEVSLETHMQEVGKKSKAGQQIRLIDMPSDSDKGTGIFDDLVGFRDGAAFSDELKSRCASFHGTAGIAFIEQISLLELEDIKARFSVVYKLFLDDLPVDSHGQLKRVAKNFALAAFAGELAIEFNIVPYRKNAAIISVLICMEYWLKNRDAGESSHDNNSAIEHCRHFFEQNRHRFLSFENSHERVFNYHKPLGYVNVSGEYFMYTGSFKNELAKGIAEPKDLANILVENGLLYLCPKQGTPYKTQHIPSEGRASKVYHFSSEILGVQVNVM